MFEGATDVELLDAMRDAQRAERIAVAHELIAAGRFASQRMAAMGNAHEDCCVDDWDVIAAEVAAELGISSGRASSLMGYGQNLIERMPRLAEVFLSGGVDLRVIRIVDFRTGLVIDETAIAAIDEMVAHRVATWNDLSDKKIGVLVDWMVYDVDPHAVRRAKQSDEDRHIEVVSGPNGTAEIWGRLRAADGALLTETLDALAATVCADDPRTKRQRRADAVMALVAGDAAMACMCGSEPCPAAGRVSSSNVVIHVLAEASTVEGASDKPGYVPGFGPMPATTITELAKTARLKPVVVPKDASAQPQYRPSTALADFVRCRDATCRWMGCDKPAWRADIDHTTPYPHGPTHASNNGCFCRTHHLMKTFYCGPGGWTVVQYPDGTMAFTSPSGRIHTTKPFGAQLFPQLAKPTGVLDLPEHPPPGEHRDLAMPKRRHTRAHNRAKRTQRERNANAARHADDPPF